MRKSVLLVLLLVTAAAVLGVYLMRSGRPASAQTVTLDRSLLALLPPNATTLVGVDLERLKGTTLYRHIEEDSRKGPGGSHFDDFMAATGFDPRRDVQELLVASWMDPGLKENDQQFVAVARGQFNTSAIGREIRKENKVRAENYRGFEVFLPEEGSKRAPKDAARNRQKQGVAGTPHEQGAFAFLDDRTALAGTRPALFAALDRKASGGPSLLSNSGLLSRAQAISATNQVWAVSEKPGNVVSRAFPKNDSIEGSNFARIFASMQNSTFALDLMNGLDLKAVGLCKTAEDAKTLGDAARGFVAIGRLAASQKEPELMSVLDGIRVEERNNELNVFVQMDQRTLEKLLEKKPSRGPVRSAGVRDQ